MKLHITGKELRAIGFPEGPVISQAMNLVNKHYKHEDKQTLLNRLKSLMETPENFLQDEVLCVIAAFFMPQDETQKTQSRLRETAVPFSIFGREHIEEGALNQMYLAAKLPVAVSGALMPDAHFGYGLPIGGVLATCNAVIPYGVGVDIGCRMCLSVFDIDPAELQQRASYYSRELSAATLFGSGSVFQKTTDHAVLSRSEFDEVPMLRSLQGKAAKQLGSSGSGNHFVEFGVVKISSDNEIPGLLAGDYVGLLSHSGSRGLGATIANHYTRLAKEIRNLEGTAANLSWLSLDEEAGVEYWMAMTLAGDYASACHHVIHDKIARQLGRKPIIMVENHHNFAWKEVHDGNEVIVHRKGATPAGKDVLGIIPGSMTANGFIVKGKGETSSLHSASHGAGRKMSRSAAMQSITKDALHKELEKHRVTLLGGGLDEAPFAYKDINEVMLSQETLVDVVGTFTPRIVKMDGAAPKSWKKRTVEAE